MRLTATALLTTGLLLGLVAAAAGQQTPTPVPPTATPRPPVATPTPNPAERLADRAIGNLAAWKLNTANNILAGGEAEFGPTPEYKTARGYLRAAQGKFDEGTSLLRAAASAKPVDPAPQYYLGEVFNWRKKAADADAAWKAARARAKALTDAEPGNARAQYYLGAARLRLKDFGPARTALEAARSAGFDAAMVDYQVGLSHILEEKWQLAVESFDKVIARDAKFAHAYYYRGLAHGELDHKDRMLVDMDLFVAYAPRAPETAMARLYLQH